MFQGRQGLPQVFDDIVCYLLNNIHIADSGVITRFIDENNVEVDFKEYETKDNTTTQKQKMTFRILKYKNIDFQYKVGDRVVVMYFDYNQELFLQQNQYKQLDYRNTSSLHSLSNGYVIMPIDNNDTKNKISFTDNGIEMSILGKLKAFNDNTNIKNIFDKVFNALNGIKDAVSQLQIQDSMGAPCVINAVTYQQAIDEVASALKIEYEKLFS